MIVITDETGTACITLDLIPLDGSAWTARPGPSR